MEGCGSGPGRCVAIASGWGQSGNRHGEADRAALYLGQVVEPALLPTGRVEDALIRGREPGLETGEVDGAAVCGEAACQAAEQFRQHLIVGDRGEAADRGAQLGRC